MKQEAVRMRTVLSAFALAVVVGGASAGQPSANPRRALIEAPVSVSANGTATIGKLEGIDGTLAETVLRELGRLRFKPAIIDGVPADAETSLYAMVVLQPRGGRTEMALEGVLAAPRWTSLDAPLFPIQMARRRQSGFVELQVTIAPDGSVETLQTVSASDGAFEQAARRSLRNARFEPVHVNGRAITMDVSIPFVFRFEGKAPNQHKFACALDVRRPIVEGQDGCLSMIEIWATKIRARL